MQARLPWLYLLLVAGINIFIVGEAFVTESTGHLHSMHGYWMAIADRAGLDRLTPQWWPYWGGGGPLEYTYAPLVPVLMAALSNAFGYSSALAFNQITGLVYCLLPVALFVFVWRLLRAPGWGLAVALAYSLLSPTELLVPDDDLGLQQLLRARRLYIAFSWDETPHLVALLLLPIAAWAFVRALRSRSLRDHVLAGFLAALMMLANMLGVILTALLVITVPLALERRVPMARFARASLIAGAAYVAICPLVPPSLLLTIQYNSARNGEGGWSSGSAVALIIVAVVLLFAWRLAARYLEDWPARWVVLFAVPSILIPVLERYWGLRFLPQPGRYTFEMEMTLAILAVLATRPLIDRLPYKARILVALPLLVLAGSQIVSHRAQARNQTRHVDMTGAIEYRVARFMDTNSPGARIMTAGSLCQWFNTFTDTPQLAWPHYPSAPNWMQQIADFTMRTDMNAGERAAEYSILWMKTFGVHAVALGGPDSPETWKAFEHPYKFDGVLEELWREDDTMIYRIPRRSPSLAHVMEPDRLVQRTPIHGLDTDEISRFVAALDAPDAPAATFEWLDSNTAAIHARAEANQVISVQVNYTPGWNATANGNQVSVRSDAIGLIVIEPNCSGDCEITLEYDGGLEAKLTRVSSATLLLALVVFFFRGRRPEPGAVVSKRPSESRNEPFAFSGRASRGDAPEGIR